MSVLALVPYFGGTGPAAPSPAAKRPEYLRRTVSSLRPLTSSIVVAVCRDEDEPAVYAAGANLIRLECEPQFIPASLCRHAQGYVAQFDLVYVTEADQVLHCDPAVLDAVKDSDYLVPHRLEQLGGSGEGSGRGMAAEHDGKQWVLPNGAPPGGDGFYHPAGLTDQYGGAFLATSDLFRRISFADSPSQPVENTTGFAASAAGHALKTCRWESFFVEHLSGHDYHEKLGGR